MLTVSGEQGLAEMIGGEGKVRREGGRDGELQNQQLFEVHFMSFRLSSIMLGLL